MAFINRHFDKYFICKIIFGNGCLFLIRILMIYISQQTSKHVEDKYKFMHTFLLELIIGSFMGCKTPICLHALDIGASVTRANGCIKYWNT
jgi:uncharacterized membrane protein